MATCPKGTPWAKLPDALRGLQRRWGILSVSAGSSQELLYNDETSEGKRQQHNKIKIDMYQMRGIKNKINKNTSDLKGLQSGLLCRE